MESRGTAVAIVDDDPAVCKALRRLVTALGYEAHAFPSGNALLYGSEPGRLYDVLLDYHMPGLAAPSLVARLRARWPEARILVMSGLEIPGAATACLAAGADLFVRKPLKPADLKRILGDRSEDEGRSPL